MTMVNMIGPYFPEDPTTDTHQSPAEGYAIVTEQEAAIMVGVSMSAVLDGIEAHVVTVEADVAKGIPQFSIVGLPDSAVTESKLRIRAAIRNSGYEFPARRITVNLSPASVRKRGAGLDLAIAIAILRASGQLPPSDQIGFCAELGLSGNLIPVPAIVNLALSLKRHGVRRVMIATQQIGQCLPLPDLTWSTADALKEVAEALTGQRPFREMDVVGQLRDTDDRGDGDFSDVIGLSHIKRAMMVAAVGRHHVMLVGPPGAGKTMLASRFVSILPRLSTDATLEVYTLHQAAGIASPASTCPPVRNPHHTITTDKLIIRVAIVLFLEWEFIRVEISIILFFVGILLFPHRNVFLRHIIDNFIFTLVQESPINFYDSQCVKHIGE